VRMGSGRGGRGGSRRAGFDIGRGGRSGGGRASGTTGIISGALGLLGELISAKRARQGTDADRNQGINNRKADYSLTAGQVLPVDSTSRDRQASRSSLLASVIAERCAGCGICAQVCPAGAITVDEVASVDARACTGCGRCVAECPQDALTLEKA